MKFGCLVNCWKILSQSRGVNCLPVEVLCGTSFMSTVDRCKNDRREDVQKHVIHKVEAFWEMAGIPTMPVTGGSSKKKLGKLISQYENLCKSKSRQNIQETTEEFLRSLDLLFDIAHNQATSLISHDSCQTKSMTAHDLQFLEDQHSERKMELGNLDKK